MYTNRRLGSISRVMIACALVGMLALSTFSPAPAAAQTKAEVMAQQVEMIRNALLQLSKIMSSLKDMDPETRKVLMGAMVMLQQQVLYVQALAGGASPSSVPSPVNYGSIGGNDPVDVPVTDDEILIEGDVSEFSAVVTITKPGGAQEEYEYSYTPSDPDLDKMTLALELQDLVLQELFETHGYSAQDVYSKTRVTINKFDNAAEVQTHNKLASRDNEIPSNYLEYFGVHSIVTDADVVAGGGLGIYARALTDQDEELRFVLMLNDIVLGDTPDYMMQLQLYIHDYLVYQETYTYKDYNAIGAAIRSALVGKGKYFGATDTMLLERFTEFLLLNYANSTSYIPRDGYQYDFEDLQDPIFTCPDKEYSKKNLGLLAEVTVLEGRQYAERVKDMLTIYARPTTDSTMQDWLYSCDPGDLETLFWQGLSPK
ncbi:hypothetical protein KC906_03940 [Candidatus Kaiserbacteria bacterium]|nr:hypothetical protein [Candidatus Kaiserbacteria bacterium]